MNLCGTALFEEIAKFCVQYYVCVTTQATATSLERTGFLSALMLARKLSAAAKSNVSSDIEELLG